MSEKCFCHFNGYAVKDATARNDIEHIKESISKTPVYYNSVDEMKSDVSLLPGMSVITLGYYDVNDGGGANYIIRERTESDIEDGGSIHLSANGVAELVCDSFVNIKQFGCKSEDETFDNSPTLTNIFTYLMSKSGGKISVPSGIFYFHTPIITSSFWSGIVIEGVSAHGNTKGSKFIYTGEGYFMDLYSLYFSQLRNINIAGNGENNGLCLNISACNNFYNLILSNFKTNLWIRYKCGYNRFYSSSFSASDFTENCVVLGHPDTIESEKLSDNNVEYVYFDNCNFEGSFKDANAIRIYFGQFIYFNNCDICNWNGKGIYGTCLTNHFINDIFIHNASFCRNKIAVYMECSENSINRVDINGHFMRRDSVTADDRLVCLIGNANAYCTSFKISGTTNYSSADATTMTYGIEVVYSNWLDISLTGRTGKIRRVGSANINFNHIPRSNIVSVPAGSTSYSWQITSTSPYTKRPFIIIGNNKNVGFTYTMSNTFNSDLLINLEFESALAVATEFTYIIEGGEHQ